jgi:hypothetical protein
MKQALTPVKQVTIKTISSSELPGDCRDLNPKKTKAKKEP